MTYGNERKIFHREGRDNTFWITLKNNMTKAEFQGCSNVWLNPPCLGRIDTRVSQSPRERDDKPTDNFVILGTENPYKKERVFYCLREVFWNTRKLFLATETFFFPLICNSMLTEAESQIRIFKKVVVLIVSFKAKYYLCKI